ncbi:MAG: MaoC family dehydratase N-terminal domain-containing protein [Deltaproteobacteria bacterium]|nr:MaoC family dehydratase N-terminal domain-containing protein [Deltaproteobacteria bacterium]
MEKRVLEDYTVGERLVTPARTITEGDIVNFAAFTGDWHPLHTDVPYAATTPFGERIAHGMLVLSVGSALAFRLGAWVMLPRSFIAFYGMDRVRFTKPVKIGDTLRLEAEVVSIENKDEQRGVLTWDGRILNQRDESCCLYVMKLLCGRGERTV